MERILKRNKNKRLIEFNSIIIDQREFTTTMTLLELCIGIKIMQ